MNRADRRAQAKAERRVQTSPHWSRELRRRVNEEKRAYGAATIGDAQLVDLLTPAYSALDAIPRGEGLQEHIACLWIVARMCHELATIGYGGDEAKAEAYAAAEAIAGVQQRFNSIGRVGASGPELLAVREMLATHDAQLDARPTRAEMFACMARVNQHMEGMKQ